MTGISSFLNLWWNSPMSPSNPRLVCQEVFNLWLYHLISFQSIQILYYFVTQSWLFWCLSASVHIMQVTGFVGKEQLAVLHLPPPLHLCNVSSNSTSIILILLLLNPSGKYMVNFFSSFWKANIWAWFSLQICALIFTCFFPFDLDLLCS